MDLSYLRHFLLFFTMTILITTQAFAFDFATSPVEHVLSHDGESYKQIKKLDLNGADFSGKKLKNLDFIDCDLEGANFSKAILISVVFSRCNLTRANFSQATIVRCSFPGSGSGISGKNDYINFTKAKFINIQDEVTGTRRQNNWTTIKGAPGMNFTGALFDGNDNSSRYGIGLKGTFDDANFKNARFTGLPSRPVSKPWDQPSKNIHIDIEGKNINFKNVVFKDVRIEDFPLSGKKYNKIEMIHCDLSYLDFRNAVIDSLDLTGSYVDGNKFDNMKVKKAVFENSKIIGSSFQKAKLSGTLFKNTYISQTKFTESVLKRSIFDGSVIKDSNFDKADLSKASFISVQNLESNTFIDANVKGIVQ